MNTHSTSSNNTSSIRISRVIVRDIKHVAPNAKRFVAACWWKYMPGVKIKVKWPVGPVTIDESMPQWDWTIGPPRYSVQSADPWDHYAPWMLKNVGRLNWDWSWDIEDGDLANNTLTIKFRKGKEQWATIAALRWG